MPDDPLPKRLLHCLSSHVQTIEQLEVLCLLAENRSKSWSVNEVYQRIQSTEKSVAGCLEHFVRNHLATGSSSHGFRFPEKPSELTTAALDLITIYRERPVAVIEAIYTKPRNK